MASPLADGRATRPASLPTGARSQPAVERLVAPAFRAREGPSERTRNARASGKAGRRRAGRHAPAAPQFSAV